MILIVDDDEALRVVVTKQLQILGFRSDVAVDGVEAVQKSAANCYEAILMDVHMPRMDGFGATSAIREQEKEQGTVHVPIIAITANPNRDLCLQKGMDDYLFKPVTVAQLKRILEKWIPSLSTNTVVSPIVA